MAYTALIYTLYFYALVFLWAFTILRQFVQLPADHLRLAFTIVLGITQYTCVSMCVWSERRTLCGARAHGDETDARLIVQCEHVMLFIIL